VGAIPWEFESPRPHQIVTGVTATKFDEERQRGEALMERPTHRRADRVSPSAPEKFQGGWLSWLERLVYTEKVGGSNPSPPTISKTNMFLRIIFGLLIAGVGALITIKANWFYENFGSIPSADKYLGSEGGSRLAYKLIGILVSVIGFLVMTNLIQSLLEGFARLLVPGSR
jgi:hypothetical protein